MTKNKSKKLTEAKVVSISGENTVKVEIESTNISRLYGKRYKTHNRVLVHSEQKDLKVGDVVMIEETAPISRNKSFKIAKKLIK